MPLRIATANYRFSGPLRLDVTRVGSDRAIEAGKEAIGDAWAPPAKVFWPAKSTMDLVEMLYARAATLPTGSEAQAWLLAEAEVICLKAGEVYAEEYSEYLRWSWKNKSADWKWLLAQDEATAVCFCRRRRPTQAEGQYHTCHRDVLAGVLVKCGATDVGERDVPLGPPRPGPLVSSLVGVTGCRPPPDNASEQHRAIYHAMIADVFDAIGALPVGSIVVTGGAKGIDSAAEQAARQTGYKTITIRPYYAAWGNRAPFVRNAYNAACPKVLAWMAPWSVGTVDSLRKAQAGGVDIDQRHLRFWDEEHPS